VRGGCTPRSAAHLAGWKLLLMAIVTFGWSLDGSGRLILPNTRYTPELSRITAQPYLDANGLLKAKSHGDHGPLVYAAQPYLNVEGLVQHKMGTAVLPYCLVTPKLVCYNPECVPCYNSSVPLVVLSPPDRNGRTSFDTTDPGAEPLEYDYGTTVSFELPIQTNACDIPWPVHTFENGAIVKSCGLDWVPFYSHVGSVTLPTEEQCAGEQCSATIIGYYKGFVPGFDALLCSASGGYLCDYLPPRPWTGTLTSFASSRPNCDNPVWREFGDAAIARLGAPVVTDSTGEACGGSGAVMTETWFTHPTHPSYMLRERRSFGWSLTKFAYWGVTYFNHVIGRRKIQAGASINWQSDAIPPTACVIGGCGAEDNPETVFGDPMWQDWGYAADLYAACAIVNAVGGGSVAGSMPGQPDCSVSATVM